MAETRGKQVSSRSRFRFSAATLFFLVLAIILEFLLVNSFLLLGLSDANAWVSTLRFGTGLALTITISPLFHLLPLTVLIVLFSSWLYLTGIYARSLTMVEKRRPTVPLSRREMEKRRMKGLRRLSREISRRFQQFERSLKAGFLRVPGMAGLSHRLSPTKGSVRSALAVYTVFISISVFLFVVVYPDLIRNIVVGFYQADSSRVDFVAGLGNGLKGVGGGLGAAIADGLWTIAPGFRQSVSSVGASLTGGIVNYDVAGKYILSQNAASLTVIVIALFYGWYLSIRRPRKR